MAAFDITKDSEVQADDVSSENHVYCILGQKGDVACGFLPLGNTIDSATFCENLTKLCRAIRNNRHAE